MKINKRNLLSLRKGIITFVIVFFMMSISVGATGITVGADIDVDDYTFLDAEGNLIFLQVGALADDSDSFLNTPEEEVSEEPISREIEIGDEIEEVQEDVVEEPIQTLVMSNVNDSVNVREEATEDAKKAGKLFKDCSAMVLESIEGWTKIESGKLIGWVSNDYLLFGEEAEAKMKEVGTLKATVLTDALRVRKEPSEDAGVYGLVKKDEVLTAIEELDEWVSVQVDEETTGYISAEYVTVSFEADHGKTTEQIEDEERAKELKKLSKNQGSVPTSVSDVTLLAALIQAEAGGEPYEGKLAVGAVVMNRVRSGGYPNSIISVITAPGQFPPATNGTVSGIVARGPSSACVQAAQAAVGGQSNVGSMTHFRRAGGTPGVVIGNHVFY